MVEHCNSDFNFTSPLHPSLCSFSRHGDQRLSVSMVTSTSPKLVFLNILRNSNLRKWKLKYWGSIALLQEPTLELAMQLLRVLHNVVLPSILYVVIRREERLLFLKFRVEPAIKMYIWRFVIFHLLLRSSHLLPGFPKRMCQFMCWFELNFAVNVLGTHTMTELMVPLLEKASPDARVITVSSGGMYTSPLTKDLQYSESNFNGVEQYARNKRVQVALTEKWAEAYKDKGIGFYSMHPGWAETPGVAKSLPSFSKSFSGKLRTSEEGADTVIWLALQLKEKLVSGAFYFDRAEAPKHLAFAATSGSHALMNSVVDSLHSMASPFL